MRLGSHASFFVRNRQGLEIPWHWGGFAGIWVIPVACREARWTCLTDGVAGGEMVVARRVNPTLLPSEVIAGVGTQPVCVQFVERVVFVEHEGVSSRFDVE